MSRESRPLRGGELGEAEWISVRADSHPWELTDILPARPWAAVRTLPQ